MSDSPPPAPATEKPSSSSDPPAKAESEQKPKKTSKPPPRPVVATKSLFDSKDLQELAALVPLDPSSPTDDEDLRGRDIEIAQNRGRYSVSRFTLMGVDEASRGSSSPD